MIDPKTLRGALSSFATGVTIVTTRHEGRNVGLTANSFNSVSLDPPLVLWSLAKKSSNIDAFKNGVAFAVHILGADQEALSNRFATPGIDKFEGVDIETGRHDVPLLQNCAARFECKTLYQYDGGDHIIFVGEVVELDHSDKAPLLFHQGKYARKSGHAFASGPDNSRDLNYLVARCYFLMTDGVRVQAKALGLTQTDHYALSVLMHGGSADLAAVNESLAASASEWTADDLARLSGKGLIACQDDGRIDVTKQGREAMIQLFALAKSTETAAQKGFDDAELDQLRSMLSQLIEVLGSSSNHRDAKHLEAMQSVQSDHRD